MLVVFIIIAVAIILCITFILLKAFKESKVISIKESLDLTGLPIVTFKNNSRNFNFLLDTGSNDSYVDSSILGNLDYKRLESTNTIVGATGNTEAFSIRLSLYYKDNEFDDIFYSFDLSKPFSQIKAESGIQIHGILGTKFFEKYKYILNFDKLALYIK